MRGVPQRISKKHSFYRRDTEGMMHEVTVDLGASKRYSRRVMLIEVAIPPLEKLFSYSVAQKDVEHIVVGLKIEVPFGRRRVVGYICRIHHEVSLRQSLEQQGVQIKEVSISQGGTYCFNDELLVFYEWIAEYYAATLSEVVDTAIPSTVKLEESEWFQLIADSSPRSQKQKAIIEYLKLQPQHRATYTSLREFFGNCRPILTRLERKGTLLSTRERQISSLSAKTDSQWAPTSMSLTEKQQKASDILCQNIMKKEFKSFLLHGITGSGKTEVYIAATRAALALGRGVLVLVPEIALTPQLVERFRAQLKVPIAVLHSDVSKSVRWAGWASLLDGSCRVALGARSAIFAPVQNLGLIVVDEEHDSSFKQSESLRYNARDLALTRGSLSGSTVVLGSATPSLETFWRANAGKSELIQLTERPFDSSATTIRLIDLNQLKPWDYKSSSISVILYNEIKAALDKSEQIFLLYNRRGFSQFIQCESCGYVLQCPFCSVSLTYHNSNDILLCHYCGYEKKAPQLCSELQVSSTEHQTRISLSCKFRQGEAVSALVPRGSGTQRVHQELAELFPKAHIGRLDRDSVKHEKHVRQLMKAVRDREIDILVGTQMLAKGHDLPEVTVVGIIDCDVGIHIPDFRAAERTFQLLTQAAGRAGRAHKSGKVILQTRSPYNTSIRKTVEQDYRGFVDIELQARKELAYPPFSRMLRIIASSEKEGESLYHLNQIVMYLRQHHASLLENVRLLGPTTAPIPKIKSRWRSHLLLKSSSATILVKLAHLVKSIPSPNKKLRLALDIDPQDML
jgi:primosomal protein N' (replication factor Y) (superfamily II helicase)